MKDVSYDNYGSGWQWHGTVGKSRKAFLTARKQAIKLYGREKVKFVERACLLNDWWPKSNANMSRVIIGSGCLSFNPPDSGARAY